MQSWHDIYFTSRDGLRLYGRRYPSSAPRRRAALCLPGLTRNVRDFHDLAVRLSTSPTSPRDVYAVDYRGRGRSAYDPDWENYSLQIELLDVFDFMTVTGLSDAAVIGTSRGGILAMLMATYRPGSIGAVVLNDIGPIIERDGLLRIIAYVGRVPLPTTWEEAAALVRELNARQFPAVREQHWPEIARQWFNDDNGRPSPGYDANIAKAVTALDGPIPELWAQFGTLSRLPVLAIRGELSDILSEATVIDMRQAHPTLESLTVRGQGHAPLLKDEPTLMAIETFLAAADARSTTIRPLFAPALATAAHT